MARKRGDSLSTDIIYVARAEGVEPPPLCPVALSLGPAAVETDHIGIHEAAERGVSLRLDAGPESEDRVLRSIRGWRRRHGVFVRCNNQAQGSLRLGQHPSIRVHRDKLGYAMDGVPEKRASIVTLTEDTGYTLDPPPTMTATRTYAGPDTSITRTESATVTNAADINELIFYAEPAPTGYADFAIPDTFQELPTSTRPASRPLTSLPIPH